MSWPAVMTFPTQATRGDEVESEEGECEKIQEARIMQHKQASDRGEAPKIEAGYENELSGREGIKSGVH